MKFGERALTDLNNKLRWSIIGLCYIDICRFIGTLKYEEILTERILSFDNGLVIKYAYLPPDYKLEVHEKVAMLDCQLFYNEKIPVLFLHCLIYEGNNSLWDQKEYFTFIKKSFSIKQAAIIQKVLKEGIVKKTEFYQTSYHAAPWMEEYLREIFEHQKENLTTMDQMSFECSQEEIDNPENKRLKIEDKKGLREELETVLDEFKKELINSIMRARDEMALEEKNMELIDLYIAKLGKALEDSYSSDKKGKEKKLR